MSQIRRGMEDRRSANVVPSNNNSNWDIGGTNDVRLPYNPCGCVYAFDFDSNYNINRMYGELCGIPVTTPSRFSSTIGTKIGNKCLTLSEPDNVIYVPGHNMLIIGEDTGENGIDYMYQVRVPSQSDLSQSA